VPQETLSSLLVLSVPSITSPAEKSTFNGFVICAWISGGHSRGVIPPGGPRIEHWIGGGAPATKLIQRDDGPAELSELQEGPFGQPSMNQSPLRTGTFPYSGTPLDGLATGLGQSPHALFFQRRDCGRILVGTG